MDGALRLRLKGDSILHVMSADPDWLQREDWEVFFSDGVCAAVKKSGDLFFRSPDDDPRNGESPGMFFYGSARKEGFLKRIRIFVANGIVAELRENTTQGYFDDWELVRMYRGV